MSSGIYTITNTVNGKIYVGFARNLDQRKARHFTQLRANCHPNSYLQAAFNKYGNEKFVFIVIEVCSTEDLAKREHYWATKLNVLDRNIGYNIEPTNPEHKSVISEESRSKISKAIKGKYLGRKVSVETRAKMSLARTGKIQSEETKVKRALTLTGYKHEESFSKMIGDRFRGKNLSTEHKRKCQTGSSTRKPIVQYSLTGELIKEHVSIKQAAKENNYNRSAISKCCAGEKYKTYKGYIWKYKK